MLHELHLLRHTDRSADGRRPLQEQILRTDLQKRCQADGEDGQHTKHAHGAFQGRGACQQRLGRVGQNAADHGDHAGDGSLCCAHGGSIRAAGDDARHGQVAREHEQHDTQALGDQPAHEFPQLGKQAVRKRGLCRRHDKIDAHARQEQPRDQARQQAGEQGRSGVKRPG